MLRVLHIENVAVIRRADVELVPGLCVLTGETGAGKSLLIDSINALTGGRISRELIRSGEERAMVSALFTDVDAEAVTALAELGVDISGEEGELLLERTMTRDGRSTARINGRAVTQALLREAGGLLINIHGQSDNQKLMQTSAHRALLDDFAGNEALLAEYGRAYRAFREAHERLARLRQDEAERLRTREMLEYQIKDIDSARLKPGEEEKLVARRDRLLYQEKIDKQVRLAARSLSESEKATAIGLLERAETALSQIADVLPEADGLVARLQATRYEVEDIAERVQGLCDRDATDPTAELDKLEGRLDTIARLSRKYGADIGEILAFREKAAARLDEIDNADQRIADDTAEVEKWQGEVRRLANLLTAKRRPAALELSRQVREALAFLDMPKVRFEVAVKPLDKFSPDGGDEVEFLIATNPGEPLQSMVRIASGGELSRIMLAVRSVLNEKYGVGTSIYDEVDAGISGRTARKVGMKLCRIAAQRSDVPSQVVCVTHSAQIASLADAHYVIRKTETDGRAETTVTRLPDEQCVDEIARILGGLEVTAAQREAARELIAEKAEIRG